MDGCAVPTYTSDAAPLAVAITNDNCFAPFSGVPFIPTPTPNPAPAPTPFPIFLLDGSFFMDGSVLIDGIGSSI